MEVQATARYMRIAPRKARLVADTVVGMPVKDALVELQFTPRAAAKECAKVVKEAAPPTVDVETVVLEAPAEKPAVEAVAEAERAIEAETEAAEAEPSEVQPSTDAPGDTAPGGDEESK